MKDMYQEDNNPEITISIKTYNYLIKSQKKLTSLEARGVDNWCGYDEAMKILREEDSEFEQVNE